MDREQQWLAARLRVSPSLVSRWISGSRKMSTHDLEHIALVLHRSPADFYPEVDESVISEAS